MNLPDENILESQRLLLQSWRVAVRQIGHAWETYRNGGRSNNCFPANIASPTLFTRDLGFYDRSNCHACYCLACLAVGQYEVAHFVARVVRHRAFNTQAKRLGAVIRVMDTG